MINSKEFQLLLDQHFPFSSDKNDEEIRIISLELENYRPYYGKHKINFSSREEGFRNIW